MSAARRPSNYGPQTEIVPVTTLGKIQRRLFRVWLIRPEAVLTTGELAKAAFPRARGVITHDHRRSIRRAALAVARPIGRSRTGRGRPILWRRISDLHAARMQQDE